MTEKQAHQCAASSFNVESQSGGGKGTENFTKLKLQQRPVPSTVRYGRAKERHVGREDVMLPC